MLSSEEVILFINTVWILERKFFSHRESRHVINIQYTAQVGVAVKYNPKKVIRFTLHPVSTFPYGSSRRDVYIAIS